MIRSNLRLVVKIAHDYANLGLPLLDLISEGNIGLMKAVERFDPAKGRQALHLRRLVDQAVDQARPGQPEQDHPPAGPSRGQDFQDAPGCAADERRTGPRTYRRRAGRGNRHLQRQSFPAQDRGHPPRFARRTDQRRRHHRIRRDRRRHGSADAL